MDGPAFGVTGRQGYALDALPLERLAVFFDFDGTLVELAERPELVRVPEGLPAMLTQLEDRLQGALAIVTGRALDVVDRFLSPARLTVAAAHGSEGRLPDGGGFVPPVRLIAAAEQIFRELESVLGRDERLILERKTAAVAVHFRQAPELEARCRLLLNDVLSATEGFIITEGKCVLEARPSATDKGTAIRSLMADPTFAGRVPVFFGDDRTDEDGFAAVQDLGGAGIKVGAGETRADYRLASVADVRRLLAELAHGPSLVFPAGILSRAIAGGNN